MTRYDSSFDHDIGHAWLQAFRAAVGQAEAEFREAVGADIATVVALGLEAYAHGP